MVNADVTDEGGETRSASRSFRIGFVAVEAQVKSENAFFLEGKSDKFILLRTNLDGNPAPGQGTYRLVRVSVPDKTLLPAEQPLPAIPKDSHQRTFQTSGDTQRPRWNPAYQPEALMRDWPDGGEIFRGRLAHNEKGEAEFDLPPLPAGIYRLKYQTLDAFGAIYEMAREILIAGPQFRLPLPSLFLAQKTSVPVGQVARFLALSGLDEQELRIDFFQKRGEVKGRVLRAAIRGILRKLPLTETDKKARGWTLLTGADSPLLEIPITENDRGGFVLSLKTLRDHQFMEFSQSVFVPWDNKELKVEFSSFRDRVQPGQKEKWTIKVTAADSALTPAAAAEILAYMYDRSLEAFALHFPPSLLSLSLSGPALWAGLISGHPWERPSPIGSEVSRACQRFPLLSATG